MQDDYDVIKKVLSIVKKQLTELDSTENSFGYVYVDFQLGNHSVYFSAYLIWLEKVMNHGVARSFKEIEKFDEIAEELITALATH